nr:MAG TPA: hypothetical protein [Caudoviricetes sp.]
MVIISSGKEGQGLGPSSAFIPLASRNRACVQKKLEKYFFPYGWRREEDMTYTFYRK